MIEDDPDPPSTQENQSMTAKKKVAGNGTGVIATIVETISREKGGTIAEIVAILSKRFPDRNPDSMRVTSRIQANTHCTSKEKTDARGLIYYRRGRGAAK
jgi:hypothetical protein